MRAPRRERSRGGGGCRAEQIAARAADAFKYALCTMHADRSANALRVVWYKGTGGRAERVVGGVAARVLPARAALQPLAGVWLPPGRGTECGSIVHALRASAQSRAQPRLPT